MSNKIWKKGLVLGIIVLFLGASVVSSGMPQEPWKEPVNSIVSNTWIVDDEGDGNFTNIQDAIDNESVKNGDKIEVYSGNYSGDITVHKELTIEGISEEYMPNGNDIGKPIVNDTSDINITFSIDSDNVEIRGFELTGGEIYIHNHENIQISNNNFTNNYYDINITQGDSISITENYFKNTNYSNPFSLGLGLHSSLNVNIQYNIFTGGFGCVYLFSSTDNEISYNDFINTQISIFLLDSDFNTIAYNNIFNKINSNSDTFPHGISLSSTMQNDIVGNNISGNRVGLYLETTRFFNTIEYNNFSDNYVNIKIYLSYGDSIKHNNLEHGISGYALKAQFSFFSAQWNWWGDKKGPFWKVFPPWYIIFCILWSREPY